MTKSENQPRVFLAVTEASPVDRLWKAAIDKARGSGAEVTVLVVTDDRWQRAASLSFTREISRVGATTTDFTVQRAEQVAVETTARLKARTESLASAANVHCRIEVIAESAEMHRVLVAGNSTIVASSLIKAHPLYEQVLSLDCEVELVE